ncbi:unnamed protein product [Rotaria socialis]|uniref:Uncharacterized protein n=2 Tax=Rotaria socialis TaxID=392032 RepID=A0A818T961_9BILA|nr:unnamed protein product [Rotaria socialis]CAF3611426.1 unnamed protein product [Rotaria socialis]CAF3683739.1 unnamed protein product [Rotaria socialis]
MNQKQLMLEWKQMCEQLGKDPLNKELIQKMKKTQMKLQTATRSSENESSNDRTEKRKNENFHKGLNEDLSEDSDESPNEVFTERSSQESNDGLNDSLHEHNEEQITNSEQRPSVLVMNPFGKLLSKKICITVDTIAVTVMSGMILAYLNKQASGLMTLIVSFLCIVVIIAFSICLYIIGKAY